MVRAAVPALAATLVLLAGCGPLSRAELKRGVESLSAIAAEGRLLADGAAGDRTRSTYTRVHARTLAEDTDHEAEKLADATPEAGVRAERNHAVMVAAELSGALGRLQTSPGRERVAVAVRAALRRAGDELDAVSRRLKDAP
jgi:hypothetical protein